MVEAVKKAKQTEKFPLLTRYSRVMNKVDRIPVTGRDKEIRSIQDTLNRNITRNVILLGPAGVGKTAIVETFGMKYLKPKQLLLEIDIVSMSGIPGSNFPAELRKLILEVEHYEKAYNKEIILFIDEIHVLVQQGAVDSIKPALARGTKIIGATTDEEYIDYIKENQALDRRFQRLDIIPPNDETTLTILKDILKKFAPELLPDPNKPPQKQISEKMLKRIIEYGVYQPAMTQPNKSIDLLDSMLGVYKTSHKVPNMALLNATLKQRTGINPTWRVDVNKTLSDLHQNIIGQDPAISTLENNLYISTAGLQDESKPQASFLFAGTTGVGKTEMTKQLAMSLFGSEDAMTRFDMSEFHTAESADKFQERLSNALIQKPYTILLFDEFDKSHDNCKDLLLQLLDDGRLSDKYGRQISGLNAYIVLTTNLGSQVLKDMLYSKLDIRYFQRIMHKELIDQGLRPEFLGRIDQIVPFAPLNWQSLDKIATIKLNQLGSKLYEKYKINLYLDPTENFVIDEYKIPDEIKASKNYNVNDLKDPNSQWYQFEGLEETISYESIHLPVNRVIDYLVRDHVDVNANNGGARELAGRIKEEVNAAIAREIVQSQLDKKPRIKSITLKVEGKMVADDPTDKEGNAKIKAIIDY